MHLIYTLKKSILIKMRPIQLIFQKNERENVVFNKENKYGIPSLNINSILPESKVLKIENEKEQKKKNQ